MNLSKNEWDILSIRKENNPSILIEQYGSWLMGTEEWSANILRKDN